jgi:hypothetical protein
VFLTRLLYVRQRHAIAFIDERIDRMSNSYGFLGIVVLLLIGASLCLAMPNLYKQVSGFANPDMHSNGPVVASGPPGSSGPSSMGQSPIAPNLPDNAMPPIVNLEHYGGADQQTNAPNIPLLPTITVPTEKKRILKASYTQGDLLPSDPNAEWARQHPNGVGAVAGKNYLNAGALIGVNTVAQRSSSSIDLRSEPANPQTPISPWFSMSVHPSSHVM